MTGAWCMLSSVERALKAHKCVGSHCPSLACDTHEGSKNTGGAAMFPVSALIEEKCLATQVSCLCNLVCPVPWILPESIWNPQKV